jgi:hypothetical protein
VLEIAGAVGTDAVQAAPGPIGVFTVDYAGQITDQTPPNKPRLYVTGQASDPSFVGIEWMVSDAQTAIDTIRYAIGTTPGAADVVGWTTVAPNGMSVASASVAAVPSGVIRKGLGLTDGKEYWASVQARNSGGLWSEPATMPFVAGQTTPRIIYVPVVRR